MLRLFWILAGVGDLLVGRKALPLLRRPVDRAGYLSIHRFGFADFVVAVGTGLAFTLLQDVRMAPIRELPLALIPLFVIVGLLAIVAGFYVPARLSLRGWLDRRAQASCSLCGKKAAPGGDRAPMPIAAAPPTSLTRRRAAAFDHRLQCDEFRAHEGIELLRR